jgi:hypothetical protein
MERRSRTCAPKLDPYFRRAGSETTVGISIFGAAEPKALN